MGTKYELKNLSSGKAAPLNALEGTIGPECLDISHLTRDLGVFTFDPGFMATASTESKITYIDGDEGVLLYRGYPVEQLAEKSCFLEVAYLLINGSLPGSVSRSLASIAPAGRSRKPGASALAARARANGRPEPSAATRPDRTGRTPGWRSTTQTRGRSRSRPWASTAPTARAPS